MKKHIPNTITLLALCSGTTAIFLAISSQWALSLAMLVTAAILDALDGFVARRLGVSSEMGAELDSLCDMANFGLTPAIILYIWAFQNFPNGSLIALFIYVSCAALRLAKFNILARKGKNQGFIGLPSPAAALLVLAPVAIINEPNLIIAFWVALCGLLMVAPIKVPKLLK